MTDILERIANRLNDSDLKIERLLDDCSDEIKRLREELVEARNEARNETLEEAAKVLDAAAARYDATDMYGMDECMGYWRASKGVAEIIRALKGRGVGEFNEDELPNADVGRPPEDGT
jgi:hypothetical protein